MNCGASTANFNAAAAPFWRFLLLFAGLEVAITVVLLSYYCARPSGHPRHMLRIVDIRFVNLGVDNSAEELLLIATRTGCSE